MLPGSGRAKWGCSPASSCRCSPWSITTSSPRRSPRSRDHGKEIAVTVDYEGNAYTRQEGKGLLLRHL